MLWTDTLEKPFRTQCAVGMLQSLYWWFELQRHALMIDDGPQQCGPNELIALIASLNCRDLFKEECLWCHWCRCFIRTPSSLLCLWCGEVPGGILGTLPHGAHQPSEAHVFGFLQPTHEPLLHNGYELPITQLSVPWGRQTGGRGGGGGRGKGDGQERDDEIMEEE